MSEHHLHPAPQDTASFEAAAQLFKYLSDPTRVRLFFILCHSEKCVIQLSECMEMSSPALSHHLRPLRAAGLSVAGMRGGMTRMTRPITLSNAMLYTADSGKANLILSNPFCILRTIGNAGSVKYRKYFTPEELPQRFTPTTLPMRSV